MSSARKFSVCDNVLEATSTNGPYVLFVKVIGPIVPSIVLRQGDKAQALTLRLLEESQDVMNESMHDGLQNQYENLVLFRRNIKGSGPIRRASRFEDICQYRDSAIELNGRTVTSSQYARSEHMWMKKGKSTGFPRFRLKRKSSTNSQLTIKTVTGRTDNPAEPSSSNSPDPDSQSVDITDQQIASGSKARVWKTHIKQSDIDPFRDNPSNASISLEIDIGGNAQSAGESEPDVDISVNFEPSEEGSIYSEPGVNNA